MAVAEPGGPLREKHVRGLVEDYLNHALDTLAARKLKDPAIALLSAMVTPTGARNVISEYSLVEQVKGKDPLSEGQLKQALARWLRRPSWCGASFSAMTLTMKSSANSFPPGS